MQLTPEQVKGRIKNVLDELTLNKNGVDIKISIGGNQYGVINLKEYTGCWRNNRS